MSDAETVELDELTMRGAWRLLCVQLLHHCVQKVVDARNVFRRNDFAVWDSGLLKEGLRQQKSCEDWMAGGVGIITFEECCEVLEIQPSMARQRIEEYAYSRRREKPRNATW